VPLGFGLGTVDQTDPFQDSVNVAAPSVPTAMQKVVLAHDTSKSRPALGGEGVAAVVGDDRANAGVTNTTAISRTVLDTRRRRPTIVTPCVRHG
jgi:methenyltetrahydromethanopterin cyclohydrolase